jgi:hypothetical protein
MPVYCIQRALLFLKRHFYCWHQWRTLKWYGLPNEPVLAECRKCGLIAEAL